VKSYLALAILFFSIVCLTGATRVFAGGYQGWSPIKTTGYAVISNYQGLNVPPGQTVVVTAGTTNLSIISIVFRWHAPDDSVVWEDNVAVQGPLTTPDVPDNVHEEVIEWANKNLGVKYLYAQSAHEPNIIGDWGVQAFFIGEGGKTVAGVENVIQIRATSFNVIPDLPVVGTAGALVTMLFGLSFFLHKKRQ
jgi:hypothetical protein